MTVLRATLETLVQQIEELLEVKIDQLRERIEQLIHNLPGLLDRLANLIDILERADLPGRLRRMEDALATLNTSIQNLHGRIDFLELNLRKEHEKTQGIVSAIENQIGGFKRIGLVLLVINMLLAIGALVVLFVRD
jgi:predicted nuclease with TOPRIM domain